MAGLRLSEVSKRFGAHVAVREVSLEAAEGELLVLVGPSGSGKSTLLRLVAGLEPPDAGRIEIGGRDVSRLPASERDVAMVFQSFALFPHMDVRGNLGFGLAARKVPRDLLEARTREVAALLGLEALLDRRPHELSGGERQRVALGRALVREPAVFLMDEPLSNLDAQLRVAMRSEIVRLHERIGRTMVYVTHDQVEAMTMGDRIGVLRDGSLEQLGSPQEVYDRPATTFVAGFIGSPPMNLVRARPDGEGLGWAGGSVPVRAPGEALLGVRPEHVHVRGSRWSGAAPAGETFRARLARVESVGDQAFLALEVGEELLRARVEPSFRPAPGEQLEAWLEPGRLHLFDPATGRAL